MVAQQKILQIISAEGWLAVYDLGSGDVQDLRTRPLACWALVEDSTGTRIVGMDADFLAGQRPPGKFLGYVTAAEGPARFRKPV